MATAPLTTDRTRLSFATVAASAGKDNVALGAFAKAAAPTSIRDTRKENAASQTHNEAIGGFVQSTKSLDNSSLTDKTNLPAAEAKVLSLQTAAVAAQQANITEASLVAAVEVLSVQPTPSLVVNGSGLFDMPVKQEGTENFSDDSFPRVESGSELGTKPPSLDGKSVASGTTYALDEKESLRPDDSASVKAAAEDDDAFSGRGSIVAGSRIGSEAAARAYRSGFYEASDRRSLQTMQERHNQGVLTPQSGSSSQQNNDEAKPKPLVGTAGVPDAFNLFYRQTPDEKLLEALDSPKDRIFLLRLEQEVIEFVKDSKEPFIDLPPNNSFCRMLTHKLADYYHMTHQVDAVLGAVRIFRTPFCRLPPPLTTISNPPTTGNTPPPNVPTMKIMRRGGDGDTGPSPSKAASETGSDSKDKALSAKEKLSREEREAAYNKARERIFGKEDKTGESTPDTVEDGNEMSRSSSVSTKDRAGQNKRGKGAKQRRDDNESFDVRSQYTPFFPQQQQMPQTWAPAPQYLSGVPQQYIGNVQSMYQGQMPVHYGPVPQQQFNPGMMNGGNMQAYGNLPQQFPQQNQARFQVQSAPITTYGSPVQSPPLGQPQQWAQQPPQPMYQNPYQPRGPMVGGPVGSIPYAFGQLPSTANPADPKSQHPIPGSFNRHAFNPKTQSFVPGNGGLPVSQPISHHGSPHHGSPHHGSPHLSYNAYVAPQQQFSNGMGYNMTRQGSNNSLPPYHVSPHATHRPMMHQNMPQGMSQGVQGPQGMLQGIPQGMAHQIPHGMLPQGMPQAMPQNLQPGHHLPNYGNPATLPPKPPAGV